MRTFSAEILAHLADRRIPHAHLLEILGGAVPLRWTDAPFQITYGTEVIDEEEVPIVYVQQWFSVGDVVIDDEGNQVVEIVFPDIGKEVRGLLYSESWSFRPATLLQVWPNADQTVTEGAGYIRAAGRAVSGVMNFEDDGEPATIAIVPDTDAEGAPGPAQEYGTNCRYLNTTFYKGIQCAAVSAEPTCDGTVAQCTARNNIARYGGFPFAPTPGTKITVGGGSTVVETRVAVAGPPTSTRRRSVRS